MDWDVVMRVLTAIALLLSIANAVWVWMSKGGVELKKTLDKVEAKVIDHDRRIQTVEGELKHLPTQKDVQDLTLQMERLNGRLSTLDTELTSIVRIVNRIDDYLREEKAP